MSNIRTNRKYLSSHVNFSADKKRGRDGTKYSLMRPTSFLTHHMHQISSAAVITDACKTLCNIEKEIIGDEDIALAEPSQLPRPRGPPPEVCTLEYA